MSAKSKRPEGRAGVLSSLNVAIDDLNLAKAASSITPAKATFGSVSVLLTEIRVGFLPVHGGRRLTDAHRTQWSTKWTTSN